MRISILVLAFNQEQFIESALLSICNQFSQDATEIIFIDDCSTDLTYEKAKQILTYRDGIILCKNNENIGLVKNYKKGFSLCQGELIFVLEGDDFWTNSTKISHISNLMISNPDASMCFHEYDLLDQHGNFKRRAVNTDLTKLKFITTRNLIRDSSIIGNYSVCCYRKSFIDMIPDSFWENNTNDWGLNMLMGTFGKIVYHPEIMSVYRLHSESSWTGISLIKKYNYILNIIPYYKSILGGDFNREFENLNLNIRSLQKGLSHYSMFKNRIKQLLRRSKFFKNRNNLTC